MRKDKITTVKLWAKKTMATLGAGLFIMGMCAVPVKASEDDLKLHMTPLYENQYVGAKIVDGSNGNGIARYGVPFPSKYDPRLTHMVGKHIEDQGGTETCWAFSTIAAIECNLIKKGYENENVDLSENHVAYFFYNRENDPLGNTLGDNNMNLRSLSWYLNGGTLQGTALSLATWSGVVKATSSEDYATNEDPKKGKYVGAYAPANLLGSDCYRSDYRVANAYFYNYNVNTVKQAVTDYGAVAIGMWMDWDCNMNEKTYAYFSPQQKNTHQHAGGHAVTIVGWDDNYPKSNFNNADSIKNNGAWIVKNSYGDAAGRGDKGYIYISYEDASITELVAYDMVKASESYHNNYQYDGTANPAYALTYPSGTTYANVFKAKGGNGCIEELKAVSVDVLATYVNYSIQIYTGVTDAKNPTSGTAMYATPQTGSLVNAGYNQIKLTTPVKLLPGEKYAVVIKLSTQNGVSPCLACETAYTDTWISFPTNTETGHGFVYANKKWIDTGKNKADLRIKAFTDNTGEVVSYGLTQKSLSLSKGSSQTLAVAFSPSSIKRKVSWSSSNKNIATVSSSGKVKGKAYGSTTIKAKFKLAGVTKTLKCKVTIGPTKIKGFKAKGSAGKITASWKGNQTASGYVIYYSTDKNTGYKKLATVTKGTAKKYTKKKVAPGVYYVKMKPYRLAGKKKLYGSFTDIREVVVR